MKELLKRRYRTIHLYMVREFFFSFFIAFLFFFIIFFVNQILLLAERVLASRVPLGYVLKLILCTIPSILALSFPFATLVGALMALGNLASHREILAMECAGISLKKLSRPLLLVGIVFCFISFYINDYLLPLGAVHYRRISREIFTAMPALELEPYSIKFLDNRVVLTSTVNEESFGPILVIENGRRNDRTVISAPAGYFENHPEKLGNFSINMTRVEQHTVDNRNRIKQTFTRADLMSLNFLFSSIEGMAGLSPQEMRSFDLIKEIRKRQEVFDVELDQWRKNLEKAREGGNEAQAESLLDSPPRDRTLDQWKMEFYQKYAIPFSCFPFVLIAFPLGSVSRRSGRAVGFLIGLFLAFLYWTFLILGRNLTLRVGFSPFLSIWTANILLSLVGLILYIRKIRS